MRRIVRSEAICLRVRDYHESSKLVTFFTPEHGRVDCLAKGARRLRSKFGAALDIFAQSRIIYYSHETRTLLTLSDAELVHSFSSLALRPERFLAAEQMSEFALRVIQPHDPSPQLYRLLLNYLTTLESLQNPVCSLQSSGCPNPQSATGANRQELQGRQGSGPDNLQSAICNLQSPSPYPALVCSFLLKAASFLGFRPELRRCLLCRRPAEGPHPAYFDAKRGGIICCHCAGEQMDLTESSGDSGRFPSLTRLDPASLDILSFLLYTPASEIASFVPSSGPQSLAPGPQTRIPLLDLVLGFLGHHFDPLMLNSFSWRADLERRI